MIKTNHNIKLVAASAYKVDGNCRLELNTGVISDERDYVSNLTKGIRDYSYTLRRCLAHKRADSAATR
jgi:hypothetical protein